MGISIQSLRVYVCILEQGSLSAAARELGMTQPAVSNHLHMLEQKFGVILISRGRPLRTTPAGERLAFHARRILEETSTLEMEMARHIKPYGRLLVGASSTPGELLLPAIAVEFSASYPDVALDVHVADTDETIAALLRRDIEVAVVGREVEDCRLSNTLIGEDELVPVTSIDHRRGRTEIAAADLAAMPFVFRERGSGTRRAVEEGLSVAGVRPKVAMELGSNAAVARAVAADAGVGVLPARMLEMHPDLRRMNIRGLKFQRPFVLVVERDRPLSPAAQAFVATCPRKVYA
jgi:DNA-binding transcriptional LysR family regulator